MSRLWYALRYYAGWSVFGALAVLVSGLCTPLCWWPRRERWAPFARGLIRWAFRTWLGWLRLTRIVEVRWRGFDAASPPGVALYVANHPSLIDAPVILAHLPAAVCIFKPRLLRNPLVGPPALLAGYIASNRADAVRTAADRLRSGQALLVFPEGTRTDDGAHLNALKPGFAVIARTAHVPLHVLRVRNSPALLSRGRAWWRLPPAPLWIEITREATLLPQDLPVPRQLVAQVAQRLRTGLAAVDS